MKGRTDSTETTQLESSEHIQTYPVLGISCLHQKNLWSSNRLLVYHEDESQWVPTKCPYAPAKLTASHPRRT